MVGKECLVRQGTLMWKFLGFFQSPLLRCMHAVVVLLVTFQLCSSALLNISLATSFSAAPLTFMFDWYHMLAGLVTLCVAISMTVYSFSQRGLHRYFPYLWGDTTQIKQDLQMSLKGEMPAPRAGGLATAVQGLGFGALLLTVLSGFVFFLLWTTGASASSTDTALHVHKIVVKLLFLYFIGHGSMALLHFVVWQRKTKQP